MRYHLFELLSYSFPFWLLPCCSVFLLSTGHLSAQSHGNQFQSLPNDPGLYIAENHCITQDSSGYLWFGTYMGLYRYDGYDFKRFRYEPANDSVNYSDAVTYLYVDRVGNIWVIAGSLARLNRRTGRFHHYYHNPSDSTSISEGVSAVLESTDGKFWVATGHGLDLLDRETGIFTHIRHNASDPNTPSAGPVSAIVEDHSGILWLGIRGAGLDAYDPRLGLFRHYRHDPADSTTLANAAIRSLCATSDGTIWVGTWEGGLDRLDPNTGHFTHFRYNPKASDGLSDDVIFTLLQSSNGTLWVGTWNGGLSWSEKADGLFHSRGPAPFRNYGFSPSSITSLYEDNSGTLWVGGWIGVKHMPLRHAGIIYQIAPSQTQESRPTGTIQTLLQDRQGKLWVGTLGGLACFDRLEKTYKFYRHLPGDLSNQTHSWIFSLAEDSTGNIWISGWGLYRLDRKTNKFTAYRHIPTDSTSLSSENVRPVYVGRDGTVWVGTSGGSLDRFVQSTGGFRHYRHDPKDPGTFNGATISIILEDSVGTLWVGTNGGGLDAYDRKTGKFRHYVHDPADPSSPAGNRIWELYEDRKGGIWIRTYDGEIDRLNTVTGVFEHVTRNAGKFTGVWGGMREDRNGGIWFNAVQGIVRLDPLTRSEQTYNVPVEMELPGIENPLQDPPIVEGDGRLLLATSRGVVVVYPDSMELAPRVPPIVISSLKIFGTELNLDSAIAEKRELTVSYEDNTISFDFAILDYRNPQRNQYAYMLEGIDADWIQCGTRHDASFVNLDPGKYVLRVKGSNSKGIWNEAGTSIAITVTPPWWKTRWAYAFYILVVLGLLYGTWKLQMRRIKMRHAYEMTKFEADKLHEVDELKSRFFANISHEFRTPLTLILGPVKELADQIEDKRAKSTLGIVHKSAGKLLNLVNELLDLSKLESGTMNLQAAEQNVVQLVKGLTQSFCPFAERKRIVLSFLSTEQEILAYIDRDKIEKALTNILSNAFKFTPDGGQIGIRIAKDEKNVTVRISDTGIGIPKEKLPLIFDRFYQVDGTHTREQEGTGIGLSLTKELVELHKGTIHVESEEGRGTTFTVRLPLGKAHLKPEEMSSAEGIREESSQQPVEEVAEEKGVTTMAPGSRIDTGYGKGKPLVLIVEDNADVRTYIRTNLTADWKIEEARDGEEGWERAVDQLPELIVSDVMMPRLDGFQLCNRLKSDERTSHIPVILLTAKAASQDKIEGFETGADDYIVKPFEPAELRARIRNLLEQRKRLHEHFRKHGIFQLQEEKITSLDHKFLEEVFAAINEHISDVTFGVEPLAECMAVSRSLLLKKLEALTGESPVALIRRIRLEKGATLIKGGFGNISEVALEVGFNNPSYFTGCFRKQFGLSPKDYQQKHLG